MIAVECARDEVIPLPIVDCAQQVRSFLVCPNPGGEGRMHCAQLVLSRLGLFRVELSMFGAVDVPPLVPNLWNGARECIEQQQAGVAAGGSPLSRRSRQALEGGHGYGPDTQLRGVID